MMRVDPWRGHNFAVALVDSSTSLLTALASIARSPAGGFSECSGLEATLEVEDYREGGRNDTVLKFPTRVNPQKIQLRRGLAVTDELWQWSDDFRQGRGMRKDGMIVLQNDLHIAVKGWAFVRGFPARLNLSSFDATQSRVVIEELDIVHEGLELLPIGGGA